MQKKYFLIFFILAFVFGSFFVCLPSALATLASPATYTITRQKKSITADHEMRVKLPSGINSPAQNITIQYINGLNLAAIQPEDVDFFYGPVTGLEHEAVLAAVAAPGVWRVTQSLGGQLQFGPPTNAGVGTIPAGNYIVIRIGMNASGGIHQALIGNTLLSQIVRLQTGAGDSAVMHVPLLTDDAVTVSATVQAPPPSGGSDPGDITPPVMSSIQAVNITTSTVSVVWNTNELADSKIEHGLDSAYEVTQSNLVQTMNHQMNLSGLLPNTMYHFRVTSRDVVGNQSISGDFTFTTTNLNAIPASLVISDIHVQSITDTSAQVIWHTDMNADSRVEYGITSAYETALSDGASVTDHAFLLSGLTPFTTYHFQVRSQAIGVTSATSSDLTFTTLTDQTAPPNISNFTATAGIGSITLQWTNPVDPDFAGVRIVRKLGGFPSGPFDGVFVYAGNEGMQPSVIDSGLSASTTYFYGAFSYDVVPSYSSGALSSVTPLVPPLGAVENSAALCTNGIDDDGDGLIDCTDTDCASIFLCKNDNQPEPPEPPQPPPQSNPLPQPADTSASVSGFGSVLLLGLPTSTAPTPSGEVIRLFPVFFAAGGTVELVPDSEGQLGAFVGGTMTVSVPVANLGALPDKAFITVGQSAYNLVPNSDKTIYQARFIVAGDRPLPIVISMTFQGGGAAISQYTVIPQFGGRVETDMLGQAAAPLAGARVQLFFDQDGTWVSWNAGAFNQINPQITGESGGFMFVVPPGRYYAEVQKEGYRNTVTAPRLVVRGVFGERIGLIVLPPSLIEGVTSTAPLRENVQRIAQNVIQQLSYRANVIQAIIQQPAVQEAVQTKVSPAVLGVAVANAAVAVPLFNGLAYLQYIFLQPVLLLERRRRKKWGVVYNALTKQPLELVIVRLLRADTRALVQTRITDKLGRYGFSVKAGSYLLEVVKPGFAFPTQFLKDDMIDGEYVDVYHGLPITYTADGVIDTNIPIDPSAAEIPPKNVIRQKRFRQVQQSFALLTVILAMGGVLISPTPQMGFILLAQVATYLFFKRLSVSKKIPNWGAIIDQIAKKPIGQVVVRIFDKKFNKVLETQVTDNNGKYGFFVRRNVYYVTAEKVGYQKYISSDIDLSKTDEAIVDQDVVMQHISTIEPPSSSVNTIPPPSSPPIAMK